MNRDGKRKSAGSVKAFLKACSMMPGGVNSPVRAFGSVGGQPFVVQRGKGAWLFDIDGNRYVDYVQSWGPLILGHAHPDVVKSVQTAAGAGTSFGASTESETELAAMVIDRMPWIERLRLVSSGTEACMTAVRIARAATGRDKIVKFDGGYHGHSDAFLVKAGSGLATGGLPASGGVPEAVTSHTISIPYNDPEAVSQVFQKCGHKIAAIIVEPVAANMGVVPPAFSFLETLRQVASDHGALLIFDEVITGFRVAPGGAAELFSIRPDLVCLGKILGGGLPIGGIGGRADLMESLAPLGPVYQAGTLSGNPLSTAAGIATLKALQDPIIYDNLRQYAQDLSGALLALFAEFDCSVKINRVESLFTLFFSENEVHDFESAQATDMTRFGSFFRCLLDQGVYLPPSGFEAWFVSAAHTDEHLKKTVSAARSFLEKRPK
ncbi:MAG: glutamate-1-semialdehyde 2,1-aminomutase [bacterium]